MGKKTIPKMFVQLTVDARKSLATEPLGVLVETEQMIPCTSIEFDGYFLNMNVIWGVGGYDGVVQIGIPASFVLYTVSAEAAKSLGFDGNSR